MMLGIEGVHQHDTKMFSIPMPDEFAGLLSHIAIMADTDMDELSPDDQNAMAESLNETLKDVVIEEIEKSATDTPRPGQILIHSKRNSENLASIGYLVHKEGFIDA